MEDPFAVIVVRPDLFGGYKFLNGFETGATVITDFTDEVGAVFPIKVAFIILIPKFALKHEYMLHSL